MLARRLNTERKNKKNGVGPDSLMGRGEGLRPNGLAVSSRGLKKIGLMTGLDFRLRKYYSELGILSRAV